MDVDCWESSRRAWTWEVDSFAWVGELLILLKIGGNSSNFRETEGATVMKISVSVGQLLRSTGPPENFCSFASLGGKLSGMFIYRFLVCKIESVKLGDYGSGNGA